VSYSEKDGQVVLTMSREDYELVLMALGAFTAVTWKSGGNSQRVLEVLNRLNSGNPHYTPYQVEEKKS
jgi:hypothetical protein